MKRNKKGDPLAEKRKKYAESLLGLAQYCVAQHVADQGEKVFEVSFRTKNNYTTRIEYVRADTAADAKTKVRDRYGPIVTYHVDEISPSILGNRPEAAW